MEELGEKALGLETRLIYEEEKASWKERQKERKKNEREKEKEKERANC